MGGVTKAFLMPILLALYILSYSRPSIYIILALSFGYLGDIFLIARKRYFVQGLLSFLAGHIFYIGAFLSFTKTSNFSPKIYLFLLPYIIYFIVIYKFLRPNLKTLKAEAFIYMTALLTMSYTCLLYLVQGSHGAGYGRAYLAFIGSVFFVFSDTQLALSEFKGSKEGRIRAEVFIMVTYILAQTMIVFGSPGA
ncbi:MAG TPA: lysoplasmalogenase [Clostridiaceae bacterium]